MDLALHPLQRQLARSARAVLGRGGDPWPELALIGVPALGLPLEVGGLDLGVSAEIMVERELGRALEPAPGHRETVLAAALLAAARKPAYEVLGEVSAARARVAPVGILAPADVELDAEGRPRGASEPLAEAPWVGTVVRARSGAGDPGLVFVALPAAGCAAESLTTIAGPALRLRFDSPTATPLEVDAAVLSASVAAARVRQASFLLGVAERALLSARDHAARRELFGRRLLELQSPAHRLAAATAELDAATMLVREAAWRCDRCMPAQRSGAQALAASVEVVLIATRLAVQLHGARGVVAASDAARAYRLAAVEAVRCGSAAELWLEAGRESLAVVPAIDGRDGSSRSNGAPRAAERPAAGRR
jgi:alkylation response protein AidB-like acyl-CoA dehydrogenase